MKRLLVTLFILLLATSGYSARANGPTAEQRITDLELTWLRAEKANRRAYPQEVGDLVNPDTGEVLAQLVNVKNSAMLSVDYSKYTVGGPYNFIIYAHVGLIHLHPSLTRQYGTSGPWLASYNAPLSYADVFQARYYNERFVEAVYVGVDGHFYRSRFERGAAFDSWEQMAASGLNFWTFAKLHPEIVKYTLTRMD